jgi:hypothetical protein
MFPLDDWVTNFFNAGAHQPPQKLFNPAGGASRLLKKHLFRLPKRRKGQLLMIQELQLIIKVVATTSNNNCPTKEKKKTATDNTTATNSQSCFRTNNNCGG